MNRSFRVYNGLIPGKLAVERFSDGSLSLTPLSLSEAFVLSSEGCTLLLDSLTSRSPTILRSTDPNSFISFSRSGSGYRLIFNLDIATSPRIVALWFPRRTYRRLVSFLSEPL